MHDFFKLRKPWHFASMIIKAIATANYAYNVTMAHKLCYFVLLVITVWQTNSQDSFICIIPSRYGPVLAECPFKGNLCFHLKRKKFNWFFQVTLGIVHKWWSVDLYIQRVIRICIDATVTWIVLQKWNAVSIRVMSTMCVL